MLISHAEEYAQQKALAGTDFDKALAISADDPSLFWLALDAVFFIADANAALGAFRDLEPLVTNVRAPRTSDEAEKAMHTLEEASAIKGGEEFARRVAAEVQVGEEVSQTERLFGKEGQVLEEAGKLAEREAEVDLLAEAQTATGDTVKVTKNGHLVICSEPCQWIRERFATQP